MGGREGAWVGSGVGGVSIWLGHVFGGVCRRQGVDSRTGSLAVGLSSWVMASCCFAAFHMVSVCCVFPNYADEGLHFVS